LAPMSYSISSAARKPFETTTPSTIPWREFWCDECERTATDWRSLVDAAVAALSRYSVVTACPTCGCTPCANPGFCRLCADADARKARGESPRYLEASRWRTPETIPENWNEMSIEALIAHFDRARRRDGAPPTTVEALMLKLRERGVKALTESAVKRRLNELSEQQLHEICGRLQALKPHIAQAWGPDEITVLVDAWDTCHG
jgi:hypothetical protein